MSKVNEKKKALEIEEKEIERNFEYSVKMMRQLLQIIGIWPFMTMAYSTILRVILRGIVWLLFMFFIIPYTLHMFIVVKDYKIRVRLSGPLSSNLINVFRYITLIRQESQLRECIEWMATDWRSMRSRTENNLMLKNTKSAKILTIIYVAIIYISGISYSALFSFLKNPIVINNKTTRVPAFPSYFIFFDHYDHFMKVYVMHVICAFSRLTIPCGVASIGIACVMHISGQIAITSWMLRNLGSGSFESVDFGRIVEKHLRAISFAKKLESYLNSMCLVELFGSCFNIVVLGHYFITEKSQGLAGSCTYCGLLFSFAMSTFIYCYIGDRLTVQCNIIGSVAYNINWYDFSAKDAKNLWIMVASTHHPVVLTAGKMATLSMPLFSSVMKASFSYLNMLRTLTNS